MITFAYEAKKKKIEMEQGKLDLPCVMIEKIWMTMKQLCKTADA